MDSVNVYGIFLCKGDISNLFMLCYFFDIAGMCTSTFHLSRMFKQQKAACDDLKGRKFMNTARKVSYTNHHWVHVVMKSESWKKKSLIPIKSIVPNIKNLTEVLNNLENEYKIARNAPIVPSTSSIKS